MQVSISAVKVTAENAKKTYDALGFAINNAKETAHGLEKHKDNPTVAPQYYAAKAELEVLKAVRQALEGNFAMLKIYGG